VTFDFGIAGFQPRFVNATASLPLDLLRSMIGMALRGSWVMWDLTANEWFPGGPVVLDFEGVHIEVCAQKFDEYSVTSNAIDLRAQINWAGVGADLPLEWRLDGAPALRSHVGHRLEAVRIIEARWRTIVEVDQDHPERVGRREDWGWVLHGVEFEFSGGTVTLFNALDANGVASEAFRGDDFRVTPL
jgi:hypothetical protein